MGSAVNRRAVVRPPFAELRSLGFHAILEDADVDSNPNPKMFEMLGRDAKRDGSQEDLQGLPVDLQFPQCCLDLAVERESPPLQDGPRC